jgi:hypothetical protein
MLNYQRVKAVVKVVFKRDSDQAASKVANSRLFLGCCTPVLESWSIILSNLVTIPNRNTITHHDIIKLFPFAGHPIYPICYRMIIHDYTHGHLQGQRVWWLCLFQGLRPG